MNYIVISPHFPENYQTFTLRLSAAGVTTLGIGEEPYDQLTPEIKDALTEYYRVDNMQDYDQMYRAVAFFAHKYGKIDRIESHNEFWLEQDAKLRTDFNIEGLKADQMDRIKYKSKMKEVFLENGIAAAKGRVFKNKTDATKLAKELGYPVVIKPDNGVGASSTFKVETAKQLKEVLDQLHPDLDYIMEEFIPGDIVTFDGLTDKDGNIVFYSTIVHSITMLDIVSKNSDMYFMLPREIPEDIVELGRKCVKAFDIKERFFHFEFFRLKKDGSLMGLELNCRPPGGSTIDMFNYANDIDVFQEYVNIVLENKFKAKITRPYYCAYISRKSQYNYIHTEEEIYAQFPEYMIATQHIPGVFATMMGDVGYLVKAASQEKVAEMINFIHATH